jgi:hypothetical protein
VDLYAAGERAPYSVARDGDVAELRWYPDRPGPEDARDEYGDAYRIMVRGPIGGRAAHTGPDGRSIPASGDALGAFRREIIARIFRATDPAGIGRALLGQPLTPRAAGEFGP